MNPDFIITDSSLTSVLLNNGEILNRFNFLLNVKVKRDAIKTCAVCQRGAKGKELQAAIKDAQRHIALMPEADKNELKRMLNAKLVRVFYTRPQGGNIVRERVDF